MRVISSLLVLLIACGSASHKEPEASRTGLQYYYIEQGGNFAKNPIQSITDSAVYFKNHLEKYLK